MWASCVGVQVILWKGATTADWRLKETAHLGSIKGWKLHFWFYLISLVTASRFPTVLWCLELRFIPRSNIWHHIWFLNVCIMWLLPTNQIVSLHCWRDGSGRAVIHGGLKGSRLHIFWKATTILQFRSQDPHEQDTVKSFLLRTFNNIRPCKLIRSKQLSNILVWFWNK